MNSVLTAFESHPHWPAVKAVLDTLHQRGFEAFLAGGCVRDALLKRNINDFDIATSAHPDSIETLFSETVAVGKSFGVIIVILQGIHVEVTTFRSDGPYLDGRHPSGVVFSTPEEDAQRRDFTINGLFYDIRQNLVVDYVGGLQSIQQREIKAIGEAEKRFVEDRLRMLRAIRFSTQLNFKIHKNTWLNILRQSAHMHVVSAERIQVELCKILAEPRRHSGIRQIFASGLWSAVFSHWSLPLHPDRRAVNNWVKASWMLKKLSPHAEPTLALSVLALFQWHWRQNMEEINNGITFLKLSRDTSQRILQVVKWYDKITRSTFDNQNGLRLGQAIELMRDRASADIWEIWRLEILLTSEGSDHFQDFKAAFDKNVDAKGQIVTAFLSGEDLLKIGVAPGPHMGRLLKEAYYLQLEGELENKEQALEWLKKQKLK